MRDRFLSRRGLEAALPTGWSRVGLGGVRTRHKLLTEAQSIARREGTDAARAWCCARAAVGLAAVACSGESIALDDLRAPPDKPDLVAHAIERVREVQTQYDEGLITDGERYNKTIDLWSDCRERVRWSDQKPRGDREIPLDGWCARDAVTDRRAELRGMVGLRAKPNGEIIEAPVLQSLAEGVGPHGFFMLAQGDRHRRMDDVAREGAVRALRTTLLWALDGWRITTLDCGSTRGNDIAPAPEDDTRIELRARLMGRFLCRDVVSPSGEVLGLRGELLDEARVERIAALDAPRVSVRWALGCDAENGLCTRCFGDGRLLQENALGASVGVRAAHAIAWHASKVRVASGWGRYRGPQRHDTERATTRCRVRWTAIDAVLRDGSWAVLNRSGWLQLLDAQGRELALAMTAPGDRIFVADDGWADAGAEIHRRDPWKYPFLAMVPAGETAVVRERWAPEAVQDAVDEVTGLARRKVVAHTDVALELVTQDPAASVSVSLPRGAFLFVRDGDVVRRGDPLAEQHHGGWPDPEDRIQDGLDGLARFLNGRLSWRRARVAPARGWCVVQDGSDRAKCVEIRPSPLAPGRTLRLPRHRLLSVWSGAFVEVGDALCAGERSPRDLLRVWGRERLAAHLLEQLIDLFARAGEMPEAAHLELVLCAMLDRVRVHDPGDTGLARGLVSRRRYARERDRARSLGLRPPRASERFEGIASVAKRLLIRSI